MAQAKAEPIYLLVTDMAASNPSNWKIPKISELNNKLSLYHFALFKHWAIQVRGFCYEVNRRQSISDPNKKEFFLNNQCTFAVWQEKIKTNNLRWERVEVGATTKSDQEIYDSSEIIWKDRFVKKYKLDRQNCQNFGYLLYKCIAVDPDKIKDDMRRSWRSMPRRFSEIAHFLKSSVASGIARAIVFELLTDALILGAEVVGLEGVIALEVLGLEVAGVALLGPIGEVIFAITIIAFIVKKSRDKKWLEKLKNLTSKDKMALESGNVEDQSEQALNEQARLVLEELAEEARANIAKGDGPSSPMKFDFLSSEPDPSTEQQQLEFSVPKDRPPIPTEIDYSTTDYSPVIPRQIDYYAADYSPMNSRQFDVTDATYTPPEVRQLEFAPANYRLSESPGTAQAGSTGQTTIRTSQSNKRDKSRFSKVLTKIKDSHELAARSNVSAMHGLPMR